MEVSIHVDGNSAAGAFAEVLGFDVTVATLTCAGCGRSAAFAESHVYDRAPGIVVRCRPANTCWHGWRGPRRMCGWTFAGPTPGGYRWRADDSGQPGVMSGAHRTQEQFGSHESVCSEGRRLR